MIMLMMIMNDGASACWRGPARPPVTSSSGGNARTRVRLRACAAARRENVMTGTLKALAPWPGLADQMQQRYVGKLEELRDAGIRTKLQVRLLQERNPNRADHGVGRA